MNPKETLTRKNPDIHLRQAVQRWDLAGIISMDDYTSRGAHGGVVKITTTKGDFALKRYDSYTSEKIPFFNNVYNCLLKNGFDDFPVPVSTKKNEPYFKDEADNAWELVPWVDGTSLSSLELNNKLVKGASTFIANFHLYCRDFNIDSSSVLDKSHSTVWIPEMLHRRELIGRSLEGGFANQEVEHLVTELFQLSAKIIPRLTSIRFSKLEEGLPSCVIHADLSFDHILADESGYKLIDFDRMRIGKRIVDIERLISESSKKTPQLGETALASYQEISSLTANEQSVLPIFIAYQRTRRAYWRAERLVNNPELFQNEGEEFRKELLSAVSHLSNF